MKKKSNSALTYHIIVTTPTRHTTQPVLSKTRKCIRKHVHRCIRKLKNWSENDRWSTDWDRWGTRRKTDRPSGHEMKRRARAALVATCCRRAPSEPWFSPNSNATTGKASTANAFPANRRGVQHDHRRPAVRVGVSLPAHRHRVRRAWVVVCRRYVCYVTVMAHHHRPL